jgi:plastocyanin
MGWRCAAALLFVLLAATADAHPGHGPTIVTVGGTAFSPATVQITQGDTVVWSYTGLDRNHTVTADDGSFDFATDSSYRFDTTGTFAYHCKVHAGMRGTVVVAPAPVAPNVRPTLSKVSLRIAARRATLRFTLDQAASVRALVRRGARTVREADFAGPPGASTHPFSLRGLRPGLYALKIVAIDESSGLSSKAVRRKLRLR